MSESEAANSGQRHSRAAEAELITDPLLKAEAEAQNGLRQYDLAERMAHEAIDRKGQYQLRLSHILALHREALQGISSFAGNFRPAHVEIEGSKHTPVGAHLVAGLVEDLCDYVNEHWVESTALHLAAFTMAAELDPSLCRRKRSDVEGAILCRALRKDWGSARGDAAIPDQIVSNRNPYFDALDAADAAWKNGAQVDVSQMEELLESLLARQLKALFEAAGGQAA